ncbi:MAG: CPBP family intramembrane metalloprotease [Acidobacteria bacterium]|nr:MAG: CPBP family intramembrane metalloprotease [Acidobacteriota bacterium]REK02135.1 MAG: CPBP family intramembrane metalloprotease [Acidobacteriota bacterium]REK14063.1 MAG: CPBP family intramembrane metalloprotease [Acidobacteriota bacterium]REK42058.1 MAG: CPBP family intramembrane metalloprotease [Acidobacteriota bacterium]
MQERTPAQSEPTPNDPPWGSLVALLFWVFSVAQIMIVPMLFLTPYFGIKTLQGWSGEQFQSAVFSDPNAVILALLGTFGAHVLTMIVGWAIVTRFNKHSFTEVLGWKWGGFKIWHGALIFVGVYAFAISMTLLLGTQDNEMQRILNSSRSAVIGVALIATFSAPIVEEVIYRGVLYSAFQRTFGVPVAIAAVTVIFATVHVAQYYPDGATILSIVLLSLVLTLIRALTGNLLPCVVFHFVFNGFQSVLLILQPYLPVDLDPTSVQSFYLLN